MTFASYVFIQSEVVIPNCDQLSLRSFDTHLWKWEKNWLATQMSPVNVFFHCMSSFIWLLCGHRKGIWGKRGKQNTVDDCLPSNIRFLNPRISLSTVLMIPHKMFSPLSLTIIRKENEQTVSESYCDNISIFNSGSVIQKSLLENFYEESQ